SQIGDYLLVVYEGSKLPDKQEALARERKLDPGVAHRWMESLETWRKTNHPIFGLWFAYAGLAEKEFESQAKEMADRLCSTNALNPEVGAIFKQPPTSLKQVAERYGKLFSEVDKQWRELLSAHTTTNGPAATNGPAPAGLPDVNR